MWGKLSSLVVGEDDSSEQQQQQPAAVGVDVGGAGQRSGMEAELSESELQQLEQQRIIIQLKEMIREREQSLTDRDTELKKVNTEYSKYKLMMKSKLAHQKAEQKAEQKSKSDAIERASQGSDESTTSTQAASEVSSVVGGGDQASRARILVLKKRIQDKDKKLAEVQRSVEQARRELDAKSKVIGERDKAVEEALGRERDKDREVETLKSQLSEQTAVVERLEAQLMSGGGSEGSESVTRRQIETRLDEMVAQMSYKDQRIIQLTDEITEKDKQVIDLQELVSEKEEVIRARDQVVAVLRESMYQQAARESASQQSASASQQAAQEDNSAMAEMCSALQERIMLGEEQLAQKTRQIEQLKLDAGESEQQLRVYTAQLEQLQAQLQAQHDQLLQQNVLLEQHQQYEQQLQAQLQQQMQIQEQEKQQQQMPIQEQHFQQPQQQELPQAELIRQLLDKDSQIQQLEAKLQEAFAAAAESSTAEAGDTKMSKFKALAGSKIKALEKEIEEMKKLSVSQEDMAALRNHVAELEEEKGNLQLQLIDMEETLARNGVESLTARVRDLEAELSISLASNTQMSQSLESTSQQLAQKDEELLKKDEELVQKDQELISYRKHLEEFSHKNQEIIQKDKELEALKRQLEETAQKDQELVQKHEDLAKKDQEMAQKDQQLVSLRRRLEDMVHSQQQELEELERVWKDRVAEESDKMELELNSIKEESGRMEAELNRVKEESGRMEAALARTKEELNESVAETNKMKEEFGRLQEELTKSETESNMLREESIQLKEESSLIEAEARRLREELTKVESESKIVKEEFERVKAEANILGEATQRAATESAQTSSSLEQELIALRQVLASRDDRISELTGETERKDIALSEAGKRIESMETELIQLRSDLMDKERKLIQFKEELSSVDVSSESIRDELSAVHEVLGNKARELEEKSLEVETLLSAVSEQTVLLRKYSTDLEEANRKIVESELWKNDLEKKEFEVASVKEELEKRQIEMANIREELKKNISYADELKAELERKDAQALELKVQERSVLEEERIRKGEIIEALRNDLIASKEEYIGLKTDFDALLVEKQSLAERFEQVGRIEGETDSKLRLLLTEVDQGREEAQKLRSELEVGAGQTTFLQESLSRAEREAAEREGTICHLRERVSEAEKMMSSAQQELVEHKTLVERFEGESKEAKDAFEVAQKQLLTRDRKIESLTENLQEEEAALVAATEELERLKQQLSEKTQKVAEYDTAMKEKNAQVIKLSESLAELEVKEKKYVAVIRKLKSQLEEVKRSTIEEVDGKQAAETLMEKRAIVEELHLRGSSTEIGRSVEELEKELADSRRQLQAITSERDLAVRNFQEVSGNLEAANSAVEQLRGELTILESTRLEVEQLQGELTNLSGEREIFSQYQRAVKELQARLNAGNISDVILSVNRLIENQDQSSNMATDAQNRIDSLRQELEAVQAEKEQIENRLQKALQDSRQELENSKIEKEQLEISLREELEKGQHELQIVLMENQLMERRLQEVLERERASTEDSTVKDLTATMLIVTEERDRLSQQINELQMSFNQELEQAKKESHLLNQELEREKKERHLLSQESEQVKMEGTSEKEAMIIANQEMKERLLAAEIELNRYRPDFSNSKTDPNELLAHQQTVEEENAHAIQLLENISRLGTRLRTEFSNTGSLETSENLSMEDLLKEIGESAEKLKHTVEMFGGKIKVLSEEKAGLAEQLYSVQTRLNNLTADYFRIRNERVVFAQQLQIEENEHNNLVQELRTRSEEIEPAFERSNAMEILQGSAEDRNVLSNLQELEIRLSEANAEKEALVFRLEACERLNEELAADKRALKLDLQEMSDAATLAEEEVKVEYERLETEIELLKEKAIKADLLARQLREQAEQERQNFETVETELQGTAEALQLEVAELTLKVEKLTEELSVTSGELATLKKDSEHSATELETLRRDKHHLEGEIQNLKADVGRRMEEEMARRSEIQEEASKSRTDLQTQYDMLAADIDHYQHLIGQLESQNSQLETSLREAGSAALIAASEMIPRANVEEMIEAEQRVKAELAENLEEARRELSNMSVKIEKMKEDLELEVDEAQSRVDQLEEENGEQRKRINELEQCSMELAALRHEHESLNERYEKLLQDNSAVILQSEEVFSQLRRFQQENSELSAEIHRLRGELSRPSSAHSFSPETVRASPGPLRENTGALVVEPPGIAPEIAGEEFSVSSIEHSAFTSTPKVKAQKARTLRTNEDDEDAPRVHSASMSPVSMIDEKSRLVADLRAAHSLVEQREAELLQVTQQYQVLFDQSQLLKQHYTILQQQLQALQTQSADENKLKAENAATAVAAAEAESFTQFQSEFSSPPSVGRAQTNTAGLHSDPTARVELERRLGATVREGEERLNMEREERARVEELLRQTEERLRETTEQLHLHQLSWSDLQSVTVTEPEDERRNTEQPALLAQQLQRRLRVAQHYMDGSSILLGRVLCGRPQIRRLFLIYSVLLHIYVLFGCLLSVV